MYRDASNYKSFRTEVLEGQLTTKQLEDIKSKMEVVDGFVPHQVGLDGLQEELQGYDNQDWDDDHQIHEMNVEYDFESTDKDPTINLTVEDLYNNFMEVENWDDSPVGHILTNNLKN